MQASGKIVLTLMNEPQKSCPTWDTRHAMITATSVHRRRLRQENLRKIELEPPV